MCESSELVFPAFFHQSPRADDADAQAVDLVEPDPANKTNAGGARRQRVLHAPPGLHLGCCCAKLLSRRTGGSRSRELLLLLLLRWWVGRGGLGINTMLLRWGGRHRWLRERVVPLADARGQVDKVGTAVIVNALQPAGGEGGCAVVGGLLRRRLRRLLVVHLHSLHLCVNGCR
jgi:hypothetical protein